MKKLIAFIMVIAMVLASITMLFATEQKEDFYYVSLGDSQTAGYGLPTYTKNGVYLGGFGPITPVAKGSFSDLMCNYLEGKLTDKNIVLKQFAVSTMRANDLLVFLDDDFKADEYADTYMLSDGSLITSLVSEYASNQGISNADSYTALKTIFRTSLKEADLITYNLGGGNFSMGIQYIGTALDYEALLSSEDYKLFKLFRDVVTTQAKAVFASLDIDESELETISQWIDILVYNLVGYCTSLDKTMEWIYSNNKKEDLTVVVTQIPNILAGTEANFNGVDVPIGELSNIVISLANNYASTYSKYSSKYVYVRTSEDQVVERIYDVFYDYETGDDLSVFVPGLNNLEWDFIDCHIKDQFETACGATYAAIKSSPEALNSAYDTFLKFAQRIVSEDSTIAKFGLVNYPGTEDNKIFNGTGLFATAVYNLMKGVAEGITKSGEGFNNESIVEEQYKLIASDKNVLALSKYYFQFVACGTAWNHPSYGGHQQMAEAVEKALESGDNALARKLNGVKYSVRDAYTTTNRLAQYVISKTQKQVEETINNITTTIKTNIKNEVNKQIGKIVKKVIGNLF